MTHRNPPARIRWSREYSAWGVTATADPNDTILTCSWDDAIALANNGYMAPTEATIITIHPILDDRQKVYSFERTPA